MRSHGLNALSHPTLLFVRLPVKVNYPPPPPVKVNGPEADPAWKLAKSAFPGDIGWNFAGIFLFDPEVSLSHPFSQYAAPRFPHMPHPVFHIYHQRICFLRVTTSLTPHCPHM